MGAKSKEERLFGAACLKIKLQSHFFNVSKNEIYTSTLADLGLTDQEVEQYLQEHERTVRDALEQHGNPRQD